MTGLVHADMLVDFGWGRWVGTVPRVARVGILKLGSVPGSYDFLHRNAVAATDVKVYMGHFFTVTSIDVRANDKNRQ